VACSNFEKNQMKKHLTAIALLLFLPLMGCSLLPSLNSMSTTASMRGSGEHFRNVRICPILNSVGLAVAAAAFFGTDGSLWHDIVIATNPIAGCTSETERLRVGLGLIDLDKNGRAKLLIGDRVTLNVKRESQISRPERYGAMYSVRNVSSDPPLRLVTQFNRIGQ